MCQDHSIEDSEEEGKAKEIMEDVVEEVVQIEAK